MKDPAGQPAPQGGFKTGGWYGGYQYWNGTFASQAGQIHPASDQQGAGETVSEEVNIQGDVAQGQVEGTNQAYINEQNAVNTPNTPGLSMPGSSTSGSNTPGSSSALAQPQEDVDFTAIYKNIQQNSGVADLQNDYLEKERQFIEAKNKINDNPFLSEATRVGREAKITELFNERTANIQNEIAMKKADIEIETELALKQIDFNSQQSQIAFEQLNSLIASGAFNNASGELIAEWTRRTGISSDMIMSAVEASSKEDIETSIRYSTADSGEETVSVINSQTGEIISQKSLGFVGNAQGGGSDVSDSEAKLLIKQDLLNDARQGVTWDQIYSSGITYIGDVEELYQLYLSANYYKPSAAQKKADLARYGVDSSFL